MTAFMGSARFLCLLPELDGLGGDHAPWWGGDDPRSYDVWRAQVCVSRACDQHITSERV